MVLWTADGTELQVVQVGHEYHPVQANPQLQAFFTQACQTEVGVPIVSEHPTPLQAGKGERQVLDGGGIKLQPGIFHGLLVVYVVVLSSTHHGQLIQDDSIRRLPGQT